MVSSADIESDLSDPKPVCFCRPLFFRAYRAADEGRVMEAGCLLREGLTLYLKALCLLAGSRKRARGVRPAAHLLQWLVKRGHVAEPYGRHLRRIIDVCNRAVHCRPVSAGTLLIDAELMLFECEDEDRIAFPWREGTLI